MNKIFVILLVLKFLTASVLYSQLIDEVQEVKEQKNFLRELQTDLNNLIDNPDFNNALIGMSIYSMDNSEYLFRKNDAKNFIPASTNKLFTVAAGIDILGADYRYNTSLYLNGDLQKNGEFIGDIIIRGTGDPTFSSFFDNDSEAIIQKWVSILDSMGLRSVIGHIIGDDSYFDNVYYAPGWAWDDMSYSYSAQVNSITMNDNVVNISIMQGDTVGDQAEIAIFPENTYIRTINSIKTVSINDVTDVNINREHGSNIIELSGSIAFDTLALNKTEKSVTIDNPTLFFLNVFREKLEQNQIRFRGALLDINDLKEKIIYHDMQPLIVEESIPLSEIIKVINKESNNLSAEILLKTIGKETTGVGSFDSGADEVKKFMEKAGISPDNIVFVDGSGLSRFNLMSPRYQISLLSWVYRSEFRDMFLNSLAVPGEKGTLQRRLKRSLAENNVIAKTGSMNNVNNIAGYVKTRDGEMLAFSIMIQNFTVPTSLAQNLQDLILMRLASFSRK